MIFGHDTPKSLKIAKNETKNGFSGLSKDKNIKRIHSDTSGVFRAPKMTKNGENHEKPLKNKVSENIPNHTKNSQKWTKNGFSGLSQGKKTQRIH